MCTSSEVQARRSVVTKSRANQTEWDFWGAIGPAENNITSRSKPCDYDNKLRALEERVADSERRAKERAEKDDVKMNFLRSKIIENEEKMAKMQSTHWLGALTRGPMLPSSMIDNNYYLRQSLR